MCVVVVVDDDDDNNKFLVKYVIYGLPSDICIYISLSCVCVKSTAQ